MILFYGMSDAYTQIAPSFKFSNVKKDSNPGKTTSLDTIRRIVQINGELGAQAAASSTTSTPFSGFLGFTYRTGISHDKDLGNLRLLIIRDHSGERKTIGELLSNAGKSNSIRNCVSEFFKYSLWQVSTGIAVATTGDTTRLTYAGESDTITNIIEFRNTIAQMNRGTNALKSGYLNITCWPKAGSSRFAFNVFGNYANRNLQGKVDKKTTTVNYNVFSCGGGFLMRLLPPNENYSAVLHFFYTNRFISGDLITNDPSNKNSKKYNELGTELLGKRARGDSFNTAFHGFDFGLSLAYRNLGVHLNCTWFPSANGLEGLSYVQGFTNIALNVGIPLTN